MKKEISLRISLKERVKFYVASCTETLAQAMSVCLEEKVSPKILAAGLVGENIPLVDSCGL